MLKARRLFADTTTERELARQRVKALSYVSELRPDALSKSSTDEVEREVVAAYRLDHLALYWQAREGGFADGNDTKATDVGRSSLRTVVEYIPFSGPAGLFDMRPSEPPSEPVDGSIVESAVMLWGMDTDGGTVGSPARFEREEAILAAWVAAVDRDVDAFNANLHRVVRAAVKARMAALKADVDGLAALGIPLRTDRPAQLDRAVPGRRPRGFVYERSAPAVPRRHSGRPAWTREVFEERLAEAERLTRPPLTYARLAKNFRGLDDKVGELSGSWLARLCRRFVAIDE